MSKQEEHKKFIQEILNCEKCFLKDIKFCDTPPFIESDLMFIAEAPSVFRDIPGLILARNVKPLIDRVLKILGRTRKDVYMTNVIKCTILRKTVGNASNCKPFILREIEIIDPKYVILFGRTAVNTVLKERYPLTGHVVKTTRRTYATMYHPSAVHRGRIFPHVFIKNAEKVKSELFNKEDISRWF